MASLRKRTGSPCWYLDWHEHPGNKGRRVLCTGIRHNNAKNPPRQGAAWDILLAKEGELSRRKFGLPASIKDSAVEAFLTAHLHWLKTTSADISPGTLQRYNSTVIVFNRWASAERLSHFSQFTYDTIGRFVLHRSGNKSSKTVAMDCAFMGQVWDEAKNRSLVTFEKNPWRELRPASIKSTARRPLTAAEISHLLSSLSSLEPWERFTFFFGLYTGARLSSIVLLPRASVDLTSKLVYFPDEIVKEAPYTVPLHPAAISFLSTYKGGDATHFVPLDVRRRHSSYAYAQKCVQDRFGEWRDATKEAKPPGLFQGVSFHSLRHTFITALRESGASQSESQLLAGHATAAINAAYTHVSAQRLAPVIERLFYAP